MYYNADMYHTLLHMDDINSCPSTSLGNLGFDIECDLKGVARNRSGQIRSGWSIELVTDE